MTKESKGLFTSVVMDSASSSCSAMFSEFWDDTVVLLGFLLLLVGFCLVGWFSCLVLVLF